MKKKAKKKTNGTKKSTTVSKVEIQSGPRHYVMVYMHPNEKEWMQKAADLDGLKLTSFIRSSAMKAANKVLAKD